MNWNINKLSRYARLTNVRCREYWDEKHSYEFIAHAKVSDIVLSL